MSFNCFFIDNLDDIFLYFQVFLMYSTEEMGNRSLFQKRKGGIYSEDQLAQVIKGAREYVVHETAARVDQGKGFRCESQN